MDSLAFVQNIKKFCDLKGVKPTVACRESGVGTSFINNVQRGQTPSVAKVQMLADYLGVTTSELLGEKKEPAAEDGSGPVVYEKLAKMLLEQGIDVGALSDAQLQRLAKIIAAALEQ